MVPSAVCADDLEDGEQDVIPAVLVRREGVEDCAEHVQGQAGAVVGRGGDWLREVLAQTGEEDVWIGGLPNQVHEEVVCGDEFWLTCECGLFLMRCRYDSRTSLWRIAERCACSDNLLEHVVLVAVLLQQRRKF